MFDGVPNSYKDPYWAGLASKTERKLGLPDGLLVSILTNGEKSNANQVSEAGARTPFQIIPATQRAAVKKYGLDPYLTPENAAEVAGRLLQDSLKRNGGSVREAVGEYIGGTDRKNWGKTTAAYIERVATPLAAPQRAIEAQPIAPDNGSTFDRLTAARKPASGPSMAGVFEAYRSGQMTPEERAEFERDVQAGKVIAPAGLMPEKAAPEVPQKLWDAYKSKMTTQERQEFERDVQAGKWTLGPDRAASVTQAEPSLAQKALGVGEAALSFGTGIAGMAAMVPAAAGAIAGQVASGDLGDPQAAQRVAGIAGEAAQRFTYAPRTEAGQGYAQTVGRGMQEILPALPLTQLMGGAGAAMRNAAPIVRTGAAATLDKAATFGGNRAPVAPVAPVAPAPVAAAVSKPVAAPVAPAAPVAAAVAPTTAVDLAATARTAAGGGIGAGKAKQALAAEAAPSKQMAADAKRLGIEEHLQPDHITTSEAYRQVSAVLKSEGQSSLAMAERAGLEQVGKRAADLIDEIGGTRDLSQLAGDVRGRLEASRNAMGAQADRLWTSLREQVKESQKVEVPNTRAALQEMVQELGGEANAKLALPAEARRFLAPLFGDGDVTYGYLDLARKQVGQALQKKSGPFANMETGQLNRFYAKLSADQEIFARSAGDKAFYTYQAAKYATRLEKGFESDLAALFGKELDRSFVASGPNSLPNAMGKLARGDSAPLVRLLSSIPEDMRQNVVASGFQTVFKRAATRGDMDFTGYAKWFDQLKTNRQAYAAVMSNLPLGAAKQLTALANVSRGISESLNRRISTGKLQVVKQSLQGGDDLMSRLYDVARRSSAGLAIEPATTAMGLPGAGISAAVASALTRGKGKALEAVDSLIASPEFANLVKAPTKQTQAAAAKKMAASADFRRLARAVGKPETMGENWILEAMRVPQQPQQDKLH